MRSVAIGMALALACLGAPTAQAQPVKDLYMVKDVEIWDADYTVDPPAVKAYSGGYLVLRKHGSEVVGRTGFLHYHSDDMCVSGTVTGGRYRLVGHRGGEQPYILRGKWRGAGRHQYAKGYRSVTRAQMRTYLGGDPQRLIAQCR